MSLSHCLLIIYYSSSFLYIRPVTLPAEWSAIIVIIHLPLSAIMVIINFSVAVHHWAVDFIFFLHHHLLGRQSSTLNA